jgi:nucleotidyltransferase substrate binding protein (TIGR01987 family)
MALDLSHLAASIGALGRAHGIPADAQVWSTLAPAVREAVRAGVIQSFEVAYEQSWKLMRRWLEQNPIAGEASGATMRQIYRLAAKSGLIDDVDLWMQFHEARNRTSHTYDCKVADAVFTLSLQFLPEAKRVLTALESRND